jgi:AAA+ ATPase superfamily predicted ATPase
VIRKDVAMNKKFVYGVEVTDYNFTGREKEIKRLKTNFENGLNVILMSPRRMGKTSLVKQVCKELETNDDVITVYLDIFGCKSEYEMYNKLASAILRQTSSQTKLWLEEASEFLGRITSKISFSPAPMDEFSVSLGITPKTHSPEEILNLAEQIAIKKGKHIVVCIDEFQQIGGYNNSHQVQACLRGVWQQQKHVSYCLFGSKHHFMSSIFLDKSMPFYQFGELMTLKTIDTEDWVKYIVSHFKDGNRTITDEQAARLCNAVSNYSSYVQQYAWQVYTQLNDGDEVTEENLETGLEEVLDINDALFSQTIESLTEYQMNFLRAIANGYQTDFGKAEVRKEYHLGSYSNIARLRKALLEKDIVESNMKQLSFTDPVFELWFKKKYMV